MEHLLKRIDRRVFLGLTGAAAVSTVLLFGRSGSAAPTLHFAVNHSPAEWRRILGPHRYAVLREAATEHPFSSALLNEHRRGAFVCAGCALPLFSSATKFESGTGWPSFWKVLPRAIVTRADYSLVMERTEVLCARCGGHLGHVFDDGPRPTGLRYCMNGLALNFRPA
jgi:peptide-methionine (R)-S-oxide reductase